MANARGFDEQFLGVDVALPTFDGSLRDNVLASDDFEAASGEGRVWTPYINYSLATSTARRQPIVVAANIDQTKIVSGIKRGSWRTDQRIGKFQLDNAYYRNNDWDRGHLARRSAMAWGDSRGQAQAASDDTMVYTNAALQHSNFNQDEWLGIEDWVKDLEDDSTNQISVFTGPIYGDETSEKKFVSRRGGGELAEVPAAFFKVVVFIDKEKKLAVRAFIAVQDQMALSDKRATRSRMFNLCMYQVSVKMIEEETGLEFPQAVKDANPLYCTISGTEPNVTLPEIIPVDTSDDLVGPGEPRPQPIASSVRIAALFPGSGSERPFLTLFNGHSDTVSLDDWKVKVIGGQDIALSGELRRGEAKPFEFSPLRRVDDDDNPWNVLVLSNADGQRMDRAQFNDSAASGGALLSTFNSSGLLSTF